MKPSASHIPYKTKVSTKYFTYFSLAFASSIREWEEWGREMEHCLSPRTGHSSSLVMRLQNVMLFQNALNCLKTANEHGVLTRAKTIGFRMYKTMTCWGISSIPDSDTSAFRKLISTFFQSCDPNLNEPQFAPFEWSYYRI